MKRKFAMAIITCASMGAAGLVAAQDPQTGNSDQSVQVQSVTVPYHSAEVRDDRGAERLFFRIRQAAEEVCDIAPHEVGYERWEEHACETAAVSEAVQNAGEPALIDYYSDLRGSMLPGQDGRR